MNIKTANRLCELRKSRGLSQEELAEKLGVSRQAVSKWETGRGFPDIGCLEDIAGVLEVSVSELLKGEHLDSDITKEDIADVASASISAAQQYVEKKKRAVDHVAEIDVVVKYIVDYCKMHGIADAEKVWTDGLPERVCLDDLLPERYSG